MKKSNAGEDTAHDESDADYERSRNMGHLSILRD